MSRRGENIFKRKDGRWEGRYIAARRSDSKPIYRSVYAHSYAECSEKLKRAKCMNNAAKSVRVKTVKELFGVWLENRKNCIKVTTYSNYLNIFNSYVLPNIGSYAVEQVSSRTINRLIGDLLEHGGRNNNSLSAKTVHDIMTMMNSVFEYGRNEYGFSNPCENVSLPSFDIDEIEVFTDEETSMIFNAAVRGNSYDLGFALCLYTGLRIGEICALQWKDIDIEQRIISVTKTITRITNPYGNKPKTIVVIGKPKSKKSVREIPINSSLLRVLGERKALSKEESYFLTCFSKYSEPRSYSSRYKTFLKRIGIPYKNFHVLRHTFATECIRKGIDVKTVSEFLGHTSVKITLEKYVHPDMNSKRRQIEKIYTDDN